jgi:hypothetical protein
MSAYQLLLFECVGQCNVGEEAHAPTTVDSQDLQTIIGGAEPPASYGH